MKTGLTLGKFAPLHRGHQLLIERALALTDRVVVLIYDAPQTTTVPLPVRAGWIRRLYPQVEVLEAWDGPTVVGNTPEITQLHDDYLRRFLAGRCITHFFSSEFYGDHVSRALGAEDCRVDEARTRVPVSGTAIRQNPFAWRRFLAPEVYRDLITKVVFLGAPSTGKTTLTEALARRFQTQWMPEYGREYWDAHQQQRRLSPAQLVQIAQGHRDREDQRAQEADRYLFVDTDATTTWMFARYYHGGADPRLTELAAACRDRYDLFFLCDDDIPYDDTPDRSGQVQRTVMQRQIRADLHLRRVPYLTLRGSLEQRMQQVSAVLQSFDKFRSLADQLVPQR